MSKFQTHECLVITRPKGHMSRHPIWRDDSGTEFIRYPDGLKPLGKYFAVHGGIAGVRVERMRDQQ